MLRREKKDLFEPSGGAGQQGTAQPDASAGAASDGEGSSTVGTAALPAMPHKNDLIVWLKLKPIQRRVYQAFLNSGEQHDSRTPRFRGGSHKPDMCCTVLRTPTHKSTAHPSFFPSPIMHSRRREESAERERHAAACNHCAPEGGTRPTQPAGHTHLWVSRRTPSKALRLFIVPIQVCNHPALLSERAAQGVISGASGEGEEGEGENRGKEDWNLWARTASVQQLLDEVHTAGGLPGWPPLLAGLQAACAQWHWAPGLFRVCLKSAGALGRRGAISLCKRTRVGLGLGRCTACIAAAARTPGPPCRRLFCLVQDRVCDGAAEEPGGGGAPHPHLLAIARHVSRASVGSLKWRSGGGWQQLWLAGSRARPAAVFALCPALPLVDSCVP